jgi:hypothetical protein
MPRKDQKKGEPNLLINCACGCGQQLWKYDKYGRGRKGLLGHNNRNKAKKVFWDKIVKTNGCWIWIGGKTKAGYGSIRINSKHKFAHRYMYEITYGKLFNGIEVLHKCDNPSCVNPQHLIAGTHADNMRDAINKGRINRDEETGKYHANL